MSPRKVAPIAPAPFDLDALRAVRAQLGAATRDDGEVFTFAPDPDVVAAWLRGGVAFGVPLGVSVTALGDLVDEGLTVLGGEDRAADPLQVASPETHDVNDHMSHWLSVETDADVLVAVHYTLHGWSYSDDAALVAQGKRLGYVDAGGAPRPRHDNTRFRAVLAKALEAAGFAMKSPPTRAGKKERDVDGGGVRVTWSRHRAESLFDAVGFTVSAWRDAAG